ncbi:MAG: hypothetical protein PHT61_08170 [Candidatus Cloacimonetes bacterium]|nr:hypothetical protein [Candidatus Cloacimonadota bacterium]MDD3548203.1 hypothetical protein [Candidatus Cloacimonadota bacterium]
MKKHILILFLILTGVYLSAQIKQSLSGVDSLKVGMPFELRIETGFPLKEIEIPDTLQQFRVLEQNIQPLGEGSIARLSIVPLRTGTLSFPKLDLKRAGLLGPGASTDAFRVFVLRSRAEADTLLREIKPLRRYPLQIEFWLYMLLLLFALALAIILLIPTKKKNRKPPVVIKAKPDPVEIVPPHLKALKALDELEQSGLMYRDYLSYHFRLSMILREYLEARFGFGATQMTGSEIAENLNVLNFVPKRDYMDILHYCDMVKFAKARVEIEEVLSKTAALRHLLQTGVT